MAKKDSYRVIGSTDVYSRKHIDRQLDRLDRLHDLHTKKLHELRVALRHLEALHPVRREDKK